MSQAVQVPVRLRGVCKQYGSGPTAIRAVANLDLDVHAAEVLALLIAATHTSLPWRPLPSAESTGDTATPDLAPSSETRQPAPVPGAYAESS